MVRTAPPKARWTNSVVIPLHTQHYLMLRRNLLYTAVTRAVYRLRTGEAPPPFRLQTPVTVAIEFKQTEMADRAMLLPGARRSEDSQVEYTAEDMPTAYRAFQAMVALG